MTWDQLMAQQACIDELVTHINAKTNDPTTPDLMKLAYHSISIGLLNAMNRDLDTFGQSLGTIEGKVVDANENSQN